MISSDLQRAVLEARGQRRDALLAVSACLKAADPRVMVSKAMKLQGKSIFVGGRELNVESYGHILVVGGGKASGLMAAEVERILRDRISGGVIVVPDSQWFLPRLAKLALARSTHPVPTEKGMRATRKMLRSLDGVGTRDLVICLISGGGSALMPLPVEGVSVRDLGRTTNLLLKAGAEITEINCVRKHLSQIAGGRLVERTRGAEVLSLIVSDVVGDDLSSIASGPTVPDSTTYPEAARVLQRRGIWERVPATIRKAIQSGVDGKVTETPKKGNPIFARVDNVLIGSNSIARAAARTSLMRSGYRVSSSLGAVTGEAKAVGSRLAQLASDRRLGKRWAAVWGGETTVTVRGNGVGGRNQEVALAAAIGLEGVPEIVVVSFGTDGIDGPTDAAGAIVDSTTYERAKCRGLDPEGYLRRNDSYTLFKKLGDLVITGPTGTNVNDIMMVLVRGPRGESLTRDIKPGPGRESAVRRRRQG